MSLPSNLEFHANCPFDEVELKKLIRAHGSAFMSELLKEDQAALRFRLANMAKHRFHLQEFPKTQPEIVKAKKAYDELMTPFRNQLRENAKKMKVINIVAQRREEDAKAGE